MGLAASLTSETAKRFIAKLSDRAAVVREVAESAGGSLESYYWMFGQYDGAAVFDLPGSHSMAAVSLPGALNGGWLVNPGNSFRRGAVAMAYCSGVSRHGGR